MGMVAYMDSLESVIVLVDLSFELCYFLFGLSTNVFNFVSKIFKIVIIFFILTVVAVLITLAH